MSSYAIHLIERYRDRALVLDSNVLLLYVVGMHAPDLIEQRRFDRLQDFEIRDFFLVRGLIKMFRRLITTPHVLAEVSNWLGYLPQEVERACLTELPDILADFEEIVRPGAELMQHERFRFLGITDTALAFLAAQNLVFTEDARFVFHLHAMGLEALNLNYLRPEVWLREG